MNTDQTPMAKAIDRATRVVICLIAICSWMLAGAVGFRAGLDQSARLQDAAQDFIESPRGQNILASKKFQQLQASPMFLFIQSVAGGMQ